MDLYLAQGGREAPRKLPSPQPVVLCFDWESYADLRREGAAVHAWEHFIPEDRAKLAIPETERLSELWYRREGVDFTLFEGISLGKAYRWIFYALTIRPAVKFLLALSAAAAEHRPGTVRCETSVPKLYRDMLESLAAGQPGWRVEWVRTPASSSDALVWKLPSPTLGALKRLSLGLANALAKALSPSRDRPNLIVSYYPSFDRFFELMTAKGSPFRCLLVDTPGRKLLPSLIRSGAETLLDHRSEPDPEGSQAGALSAMREVWKRAKQDPAFRAAHSFAGTSLWPAVEPAVEDFFAEKAGPLLWTVSRLDSVWRREKPAAALLAFDEPPIQHLVTDLARKHGTPSLTVLHGLPEFTPSPFGGGNARFFSAWGPTLRDRCAAPGDHGDRECLAIGNPYFDLHFRTRKPVNPGPIRNILVLSSPPRSWIMMSSDLEPQTYATTVCEALRGAPAKVTFKLHPCESLPYNLRLLEGCSGIEIVKHKPIMDCLLAADLVIGSFSTVLLEAIILNKPILLVNLTRTRFAQPFDGSWGVEPLRSLPQIRSAVERLLGNPREAIPEICRPYARIVGEFVGPADDRSSERLLAEIRRLASASRPA